MKLNSVGLFCAAAASMAASQAAAQLPVTPRSLGMAGANVAVARGQESLFQNPANLALPNNPHWSVAVPQFTVGATVAGLTLGDLNDLRGFDDFSEGRRQEILDAIPGDGTAADLDLRLPLASFSVRRAMFGVSYNLTGRHTAAKDLVDLVLNGYELGRPYPDRTIIAQTQGYRAAYFDFAGGYAHRVGPLSLGVSGHYLMGRGLVRSGLVDIDTIFTPPGDVRVRYAGVKREGGSGFGLDVGAAFQPTPQITLSASVANVVNTLEWKDEAEIRFVDLDRDNYGNGDPDVIRQEYSATARPLSQADATVLAQARAAGLVDGVDEGATLTPVLRVGAAWEARPGTTVAAAYQDRQELSRLTGPWYRSLSVGVQHKIPVLTLRGGLATDMDAGTMLSGGLSLGPLHLAAARLGGTGPNDGPSQDGWVFSFGFGSQTNSRMR
jgi:hypothetical protein